jgi:hypothetical protein
MEFVQRKVLCPECEKTTEMPVRIETAKNNPDKNEPHKQIGRPASMRRVK